MSSSLIRPALVSFALLSLVTGFVYPLATTGVAQSVFPQQAAGSLIERDGKVVGSQLIGQTFTSPAYFWGRPSATAPMGTNASSSGGSNQGSSNPALQEAVNAHIANLRAADPGNPLPVPVDLVTASASGLDPEISVAAADYQAARVARARKLHLEQVQRLIEQYTQGRTLGLLGENRVNVLQLNVALDALAPMPR